MPLTRIKIGDIITLLNEKNTLGENLPFLGLNKEKEFIQTIANIDGLDPTKYNILKRNYFAFNGMHVGRDVALPLGLYTDEKMGLISPAYKTFVVDEGVVIPEYFFMIFNSDEKARYCAFLCDGDIREGFDWENFCNIEVELPPLEIQKKYVAIYDAMMKNQKTYETGLDDLKLVFESTIEKLRKEYKCEEIGPYIEQSSLRNTDLKYNLNDVMGISQNKKFVKTVADGSGNDISKYYIVKKDDFAYSPRNGTAVALNNECKEFIISFNNTCFYIKENAKNILLPEYLFLFFLRDEWSRKTTFDSWGSTVPLYQFDRLKTTTIPIPPLDVQQSIVSILNAWQKRIKINEKIKTINKTLCPILIKGSLEES